YAGLDYNYNAYPLKSVTGVSSYIGQTPRYNAGMDMSLKISAKLRPRIEVKYVNMRYDVDWDNNIYNIENTKINVHYLDFDLRCDYLLTNAAKKYSIYVSPGLKYETEVDNYISRNWNFLETKHPSNSFGGAVAVIFKYNITKMLGFTVTPEYTSFFREFTSGNGKPFSRFSCNAGFEFGF
ncbi:MAG TPA: hypothetical protein VHO90_14945, partial [Bacteroidales bacterium]|nr:hypothetical protein [Bacteroidales bacterium]